MNNNHPFSQNLSSSPSDLVLVTGGAGFIGSNVISRLNKRGYTNILIIDDLGHDEKWKNLQGLSFRAILPIDLFKEIVKPKEDRITVKYEDIDLDAIKTVIHLGACSSTTEKDADYLFENNYQFSVNLFKWIKLLNPNVRFVYASSAATYGDGSFGYEDTYDLEYLEKLRPLNMYGYSKHLFDLWLSRNGFMNQVCGLKYFNVYGQNESHKSNLGESGMESFVLKAYNQLKEKGKINLFKSGDSRFSNGEYVRDFIYVNDAADITVFAAIDRSITMNGLYNVGTGQETTFNELVYWVIHYFNANNHKPQKNYSTMEILNGERITVQESQIEYIDMPESIANQYQYHTVADISKLRERGYNKRMFSIEQGVGAYINGFLAKK